MAEGTNLEYKESLDLSDLKDRLSLIKEVVAFANASGGRILVGVRDNGEVVGVPEHVRSSWDAAKIGDMVDAFIEPDHLELRVEFRTTEAPSGTVVVEIDVPRFESPPLVLSKDGNHGGSQSPAFRKHAVIVRHNTKAEPARRTDFLRWREDLRNRILQQFQMVISAPETAHLRMIGDDEVRDEPNFFLSRAVDLFRQRPEKLLDGDDLLYLFENRDLLDYSIELVPDLLVHSALRRRATLFFWLAFTSIDRRKILELLRASLVMSDRDKSDMASAIPLVAAIYLSADDYAQLIAAMAASKYAHIVEAANEFPTLDSGIDAIGQRRSSAIDGRPLSDFGDGELLAAADQIISESNPSKASRRLPNLGLEYLLRRQRRH
jgi:hypothetical protein